MAGGRPLIPVTEPTSSGVYKTYRAQNDTSFMRYERMSAGQKFHWRVYSTDGTTYFFGDGIWTLGCQTSDGFAPLTRAVDAFGNEVIYQHESAINGECRIKKIFWGQNASAGLTNLLGSCSLGTRPRNAGTSRPDRNATTAPARLIVAGASKLLSITATAFPPGSPTAPEHTRVVTLNYSAADESCTTTHAPLRLLTSIQEHAFGTDSPRVDLPAVTFEYGDATINLVTPRPPLPGTPWGGSEPRRHNLGWGYRRTDDRWPTVEAMMLDLDGDGLLDRVSNASTEKPPGDGQCKARWRRNLGPAAGTGHPQFGAEQTFTLPRLKWNGATAEKSPLDGAASADPEIPAFRGLRAQRPGYLVPELNPGDVVPQRHLVRHGQRSN